MERRATCVLRALFGRDRRAALVVGFTAGGAVVDPADPVADMRQMHEKTYSSHGGMGMVATWRTWTRCIRRCRPGSRTNRALHDRIHEACRLTNERTES